MIRGDQPVKYASLFPDDGRVGSPAVDMAVKALSYGELAQHAEDLGASVIAVKRRIVQEHQLLPVSRGRERGPQAALLPAKDLSVVFGPGLLLKKPAAGAADGEILP